MDELNQLRSERKQREFQNYELDKQMLRQITEHRAASHAKLHEQEKQCERSIEALKMKDKYKDADNVEAALSKMTRSGYTEVDREIVEKCRRIMNDN